MTLLKSEHVLQATGNIRSTEPFASNAKRLEQEAVMSTTLILAVGLDSPLLNNQSSNWRSAGYILAMAGSIGEAVSLFRAIDVDLVLFGDSISGESRDKLAFLIRASGSRVPVVCITDSPVESDSFADAIIGSDSSELLQCTGELLAKRARTAVPERNAL